MNHDGLIVKELIAKHLIDHHPGTYKLVDYNDLVKTLKNYKRNI